jgi:hypothetical protein
MRQALSKTGFADASYDGHPRIARMTRIIRTSGAGREAACPWEKRPM